MIPKVQLKVNTFIYKWHRLQNKKLKEYTRIKTRTADLVPCFRNSPIINDNHLHQGWKVALTIRPHLILRCIATRRRFIAKNWKIQYPGREYNSEESLSNRFVIQIERTLFDKNAVAKAAISSGGPNIRVLLGRQRLKILSLTSAAAWERYVRRNKFLLLDESK